MRLLATCLRWFARLYGGLAVVVIFVGTVASNWTEIGSPFNLWNIVAVLLTLAPALLANWLADRLSR